MTTWTERSSATNTWNTTVSPSSSWSIPRSSGFLADVSGNKIISDSGNNFIVSPGSDYNNIQTTWN